MEWKSLYLKPRLGNLGPAGSLSLANSLISELGSGASPVLNGCSLGRVPEPEALRSAAPGSPCPQTQINISCFQL